MDSLADLPQEIPVHRLPAYVDDWPSYASRWVAGRLERWFGACESAWRAGLKRRFQRIHDCLSFPDRGIWRFPLAVCTAVDLHRRYRFDAIFSTGMPFSDHVIGLAVQSIIRRPWLADFRDPWVEYAHWHQWRSEAGRRMTRLAEAAVVYRAAYVISVNDHMTERFRHRYAKAPASRFVTIANGYDPADFTPAGSRREHAQFRLLYAGSLYGARSPANLLAAFRRFVTNTPGARGRVRFDFAGRPGPHVELLQDSADQGAVRYLGMLPHRAVLREFADADVNVIILPNLPGGENDTTARIYECLGSGRPVLAAVPAGGAAARTLEGFDGIWTCDPDDVEAQADAIGELYRSWLAGDLKTMRCPEALSHMTRRFQTRQLAACLSAAVAARKQRIQPI
jgi:glycosyltransferase involved in cell wall biosynthesis